MAATTGTSTITRPERTVRESAVIAELRDDPVQDVIGLVQDSGGAVEFVAPGSPSDIGRIGLLVGRSR